jgi:hypothetical protein
LVGAVQDEVKSSIINAVTAKGTLLFIKYILPKPVLPSLLHYMHPSHEIEDPEIRNGFVAMERLLK